MSLNIKNFKVLNTTNGLMPITGRNTNMDNILSQINLKNNVTEGIAIPGTPSTISSGGLSTTAHMNSSFIKINRFGELETNDNINVFNKLRILYYFGDTSAQNTICYGWANNSNQDITTIEFNVLFANCNAQTEGDYVDIDLPDDTFYPNLYLVLVLFNDIWTNRIIENETNKICSIYSNQDYFCIHPDKSNTSDYPGNDTNQSHCIVTRGFNSIEGKNVRVVVGFEDHYIDITDKDYNDVVLVITDPLNDELNVNDNILN
jgi:hypothetical protein